MVTEKLRKYIGSAWRMREGAIMSWPVRRGRGMIVKIHVLRLV